MSAPTSLKRSQGSPSGGLKRLKKWDSVADIFADIDERYKNKEGQPLVKEHIEAFLVHTKDDENDNREHPGRLAECIFQDANGQTMLNLAKDVRKFSCIDHRPTHRQTHPEQRGRCGKEQDLQ